MLVSAFATSAKIQSRVNAASTPYWPKDRAHGVVVLGERDEDDFGVVGLVREGGFSDTTAPPEYVRDLTNFAGANWTAFRPRGVLPRSIL